MGGFSLWHWLVVGVIVLLLFGKGRFSEMMGDVAKGIKSFKKGMTEDEEAAAAAAATQRRIADERAADPAPPRAVATDLTADPASAQPTIVSNDRPQP